MVRPRSLSRRGPKKPNSGHKPSTDPVPTPVVQPPVSPPSEADETFVPTTLTPGGSATVYYVDATAGSNAADGLTTLTPIQTLQELQSRMVAGDWGLLKCGEVWDGPFIALPNGTSDSNRTVLTSYGTGDRPKIRNGSVSGSYLGCNYIALVDLEFERTDTNYVEPGIVISGPGLGVLIEGCYVHHYKFNIIMDASGTGGYINGAKVRGCVISDAYFTDTEASHSTGFYQWNAINTLCEWNVLDNNGHNDPTDQTGGTQQNHNNYSGYAGATAGYVFRKNLSSRASFLGVSAGSGGTVQDNAFIVNGSHFVGDDATVSDNVFWGDGPNAGGYVLTFGIGSGIATNTGTLSGNVFDGSQATLGYGVVMITTATEMVVDDNDFYDAFLQPVAQVSPGSITNNRFQNPGGGQLFLAEFDMVGDFTFSGNSYYSADAESAWFTEDLGSGVDATVSYAEHIAHVSESGSSNSEVTYVAATRAPADYMQSLGQTATTVAFIDACRANRVGSAYDQSNAAWNDNYTGPAFNAYKRAGMATV